MNESQNKADYAFSLLYGYDNDDGYHEQTVDWNWKTPGWSHSELVSPSCRKWENYPGLNQEAYKGLLKRFNLNDKKSEFPLEKIVNMSPSELAEISKINPSSDTIGDSRKASEVLD